MSDTPSQPPQTAAAAAAVNSFGQRAAGDPRSVRAFNVGPPSIGPMHADGGWQDRRWYDAPREDPAWPEVHTYTDAISYDPGDTVVFHSSTHAARWSLEVVRDGLQPETVFRRAESAAVRAWFPDGVPPEELDGLVARVEQLQSAGDVPAPNHAPRLVAVR